MDYSHFSHYCRKNLWRGICVIKLDLKLVNFSKSNIGCLCYCLKTVAEVFYSAPSMGAI